MVAVWMRAKRIKIARERRSWARAYTVKGSAGVNWHNGQQMRETSLDINEEIRARNESNTRKQPVPDISAIRKEIPDPFFVLLTNTPFHRCKMFYDLRDRKFILQWVDWRKKEARISITYGSPYRAKLAWQEDRVRWRKTIQFGQ